jgi:hypothetical protein
VFDNRSYPQEPEREGAGPNAWNFSDAIRQSASESVRSGHDSGPRGRNSREPADADDPIASALAAAEAAWRSHRDVAETRRRLVTLLLALEAFI